MTRIGGDRRIMVSMRRAAKHAADHLKKSNASPAGPSRRTRDRVARIRQRRDEIRERVGVLSDSAVLIREDRDRQL